MEQTVCESKLGFVNCPLGQVIQIDSVLYGRTQQSVCNQFNAPISNLNCKSTSVSTNSVTNYCQGRSACLLTADNAQLGEDPCPQVPKYLQVNIFILWLSMSEGYTLCISQTYLCMLLSLIFKPNKTGILSFYTKQNTF